MAKALEEWLPQVINQVDPWMSAKSIESGKLSISQISEALETTNFGIICVTPENQNETWLNFEAGALSKAVRGANASAIPLLIGFKNIGQLGSPLSNYQAHMATKSDIKSIVHAINNAMTPKRDIAQLDAAFEKWWPDLSVSIDTAEAWVNSHAIQRTVSRDEKVDQSMSEILQSVKTLMLQVSELTERLTITEGLANGTLMRVRDGDFDYHNFLERELGRGGFGLRQERTAPLSHTIVQTISKALEKMTHDGNSSASVGEDGLITVTTSKGLSEFQESQIFSLIFGSRTVDERINFELAPNVAGNNS